MPFVEIYKTNNDGLQEIAAICELNKEFVVCKGEKIFIENLKKDGIYVKEGSVPSQYFYTFVN